MANEIKGLDKLVAQLESLKDMDVEKVGLAGAYKLLQGTTERCPVRTGFLRQSGYVEGVPEKGANLIYGAEYSFYVEFDKHPWIRPTIDEDSDKIIQAMKDEANREMEAKIK